MKKSLVIAILASVLFAFFWIYMRPTFVRISCLKKIEDAPGEWRAGTFAQQKGNNDYRVCLVKNGLAPESVLINLQ